MKNWLDTQKILRRFGLGRPTVFQGFWHGPPLGPLREACLDSFIQMGHTFELFTYASINVPNGVILKKAVEIIPFEQVFYYDNPHTGLKDLGPFSDLFRFKLLSERGGWWMDVDTICLSPDIPTVERAWAQQLPEINPNAIGSGQIALRKGDPLAIELYSRCYDLSRTNFQPREALGPHLLSSTIKDMQLPQNVFGSPDTFYPIRWIEMFKLWLPQFRDEVMKRSRNAMFMAIFQSFPQYIGLTMAKLPPRGSYLAEIFSVYLAHFEGAGHYTEEEIIGGARAFFQRNAAWAIQELKAVSDEATIAKLGLSENEM